MDISAAFATSSTHSALGMIALAGLGVLLFLLRFLD